MNRRGFCIFIDTVCEGAVPLVKGTTGDDAGNAPEGVCLFRTELEAQHEIADALMIRLQEFLDGERDFEDAITPLKSMWWRWNLIRMVGLWMWGDEFVGF